MYQHQTPAALHAKVYVCQKTISNDGQVKSFVDDLIKERGTVSMRVALVLRSAEVLPLFL